MIKCVFKWIQGKLGVQSLIFDHLDDWVKESNGSEEVVPSLDLTEFPELVLTHLLDTSDDLWAEINASKAKGTDFDVEQEGWLLLF